MQIKITRVKCRRCSNNFRIRRYNKYLGWLCTDCSTEKISSIILCILGTILVIDGVLVQFFNMGIRQNTFAGKPLTLYALVIIYCISFIILSIKYEKLLSKKYVIIPLYIMIIQTAYSLITK